MFTGLEPVWQLSCILHISHGLLIYTGHHVEELSDSRKWTWELENHAFPVEVVSFQPTNHAFPNMTLP